MKKSILAASFCIFSALGPGSLATAGSGLHAPAGPIILGEKRPATFNHQTHEAAGLSCGACHHDNRRDPLTAGQIAEMASGAELACSGCHNESFANPELRKRMDLFHAGCRDCHQQEVEGLKGPSRCNDCHISR